MSITVTLRWLLLTIVGW